MAFNNHRYRDLLVNGIHHGAAKILAESDPEVDKLREEVASLKEQVSSLLAAQNAGDKNA